MNIQQSPKALKPENALTNWIEQVTVFQQNYILIRELLNAKNRRQVLTANMVGYIGQCAVKQFVALLSAMEQVLEKLLMDMLDDSFPLIINGKDEKLADHTRLLTKLNKRAQIMLQLAALPAC